MVYEITERLHLNLTIRKMAFVDWLKDTATINTITYSEDAYWKESKVVTPLYTDIKCRLGKWSPKLMKSKEKEEKMVMSYKLYVLPENAAAIRGDQIVINGLNYIIYWWQAATWWDTNHYIYNIVEEWVIWSTF